jgi:hypothetical protein
LEEAGSSLTEVLPQVLYVENEENKENIIPDSRFLSRYSNREHSVHESATLWLRQFNSISFGVVGSGVQLDPLGTAATNRPIVPAWVIMMMEKLME